ncbi:response regulator transcription factor [Gephyromycinifex aptenodytis]|uniref:response regulator transcription factor n=1 Tax=Gephyromycinifex aptenodytis TaxID=2716227 RepID=UPI001445A186|nr:response regulator transcription factor [Gephyromycinifex aptenodytis]
MTTDTPTAPVRVLVVDDDDEFRFLLVKFLDLADDLEVVGEVSAGAHVVPACEELRPEVVLMDIHMPDVDGIEATTRLTKTHPEIVVLALTVMADPATIARMLRAGARGYLLKSTNPSELAAHVRAVRAGGGALSPSVAAALINDVRRRPAPSAATSLPRPSEAEQQVLDGLARGLTNARMAEELSISTSAVKARLESLSRKWEISGRTRLLMAGVQSGYVLPPPAAGVVYPPIPPIVPEPMEPSSPMTWWGHLTSPKRT